MRKTKTSTDDARIVAAALSIVGGSGWEALTIAAIAKTAKIPAAALQSRFAKPNDLVALIAAEIDREAFASLDSAHGTAHDRLFDLLMARFDILQKHRSAILSMAKAARRDPALSRALASATIEGTYRMIEKSELTLPPRPALALGIGAIYAYAFVVWRKDDSRDMARTMAAVDRALRWADKAMRLVKRRS
jgi:AcrR family transcriptional regulator